jgi:hypothetical protein
MSAVESQIVKLDPRSQFNLLRDSAATKRKSKRL